MTIQTTLPSTIRRSSATPAALLAAGTILALATGPRWNLAPLAWLAPVPFLLFARRAHGWRAWGALLGTLIVAHSIQTALLATTPVATIGTMLFGPPLALLRFGAIATGEWVRRRTSDGRGLLAYVLATLLLDWVGYGATELGAWMATANSQVGWLELMQLASLGGLATIGALMAWVAGSLAMAIDGGSRRMLGAALLSCVAALAWGTTRLTSAVQGPTVTVAAVTTEVGPGETGMPDDATLAANTNGLFARTHLAASRGARIVVWNEVATLVSPADEDAFLARARSTAQELDIDLVLAYAVLESETPILLDNKYVFIGDDGAVLDEYQKHHPVPGEPSIRGSGALRLLDRPYGRVGGAICYDYDFPAIAREHARGGADLVVVPSSDWRGIHPVHTLMARVRAIEGGFSLVRSTRWAASGMFDRLGTTRAWMPPGEDGVLVAQVPIARAATIATRIGDAPIAAAAFVLVGLILTCRRR
jgi:apolipoprotein N-acyltransferase